MRRHNVTSLLHFVYGPQGLEGLFCNFPDNFPIILSEATTTGDNSLPHFIYGPQGLICLTTNGQLRLVANGSPPAKSFLVGN